MIFSLLMQDIRSAFVNVWKKKGVRSVCAFNSEVVSISQNDSVNFVEMATLNLPTPISQDSKLHVVGTKNRRIDLS